jgi:hypothetical protein
LKPGDKRLYTTVHSRGDLPIITDAAPQMEAGMESPVAVEPDQIQLPELLNEK